MPVGGRDHVVLRTSCTLGLLVLSASAVLSQTAPELIQKWYAENNICRGSTNQALVKPACDRREQISAQLEAMGLCYGVLSFGYNSKWEICSPSKGQTVAVKNVGSMNLSTFECRSVDRSSFIGRVCHDMDREVLVVLVNGTYYAYCRVELSDAMEFVSAPSMGQYLNANFKGHKECR